MSRRDLTGEIPERIGLASVAVPRSEVRKKDDESIIRKHLRPRFGAMRLRDIGVEETEYRSEKIDDAGLSREDGQQPPDAPDKRAITMARNE